MKRLTVLSCLAWLVGWWIAVASPSASAAQCLATSNSRDFEEQFTKASLPTGVLKTRSYAFYLNRQAQSQGSEPLIVLLHPLYSSGCQFSSYIRIVEQADAFGVNVIAPDALQSTWNAGTFGPGSNPDDLGFIKAVIDDFAARHPGRVDRDRIYLMGMSMGGGMSYRAACQSADFAAMVVMSGAEMRHPAGALPSNDPNYLRGAAYQCTGGSAARIPHPIPMMVVHGTQDACFTYRGVDDPAVRSTNSRKVGVPGVESLVSDWAAYNNFCVGDILTAPPAPVPAGTQTHDSLTDTTVACREIPAAACAKGAAVRFCKITNGGHVWPGARRDGQEDTLGELLAVSCNHQGLSDGSGITTYKGTRAAFEFLFPADAEGKPDKQHFTLTKLQ